MSDMLFLLLLPPGLWNASCVNGRQQFRGYGWPGLMTSHPTGTADTSIRGKFVVSAADTPSGDTRYCLPCLPICMMH